MEMSHLGDLLFLKAVDRQIDDWVYGSRGEDIVVATIAIAIFLPILLAVPLAIKLESRGPIIFRQKRVGLNGSIFEVWKFRSMYTEQTDPNAALQTGKDDPRVTRVGALFGARALTSCRSFQRLEGVDVRGRTTASRAWDANGRTTSRGAGRQLRCAPTLQTRSHRVGAD